MADTDTPCRVSADELAHDRAENAKPWHVCTRCQAKCWTEDARAENWLVCELADCPVELCEECCADLLFSAQRFEMDRIIYVKYLDWEAIHNLGYCSPGCMAKALESTRKLYAEAVQTMRDRNWGKR